MLWWDVLLSTHPWPQPSISAPPLYLLPQQICSHQEGLETGPVGFLSSQDLMLYSFSDGIWSWIGQGVDKVFHLLSLPDSHGQEVSVKAKVDHEGKSGSWREKWALAGNVGERHRPPPGTGIVGFRGSTGRGNEVRVFEFLIVTLGTQMFLGIRFSCILPVRKCISSLLQNISMKTLSHFKRIFSLRIVTVGKC